MSRALRSNRLERRIIATGEVKYLYGWKELLRTSRIGIIMEITM